LRYGRVICFWMTGERDEVNKLVRTVFGELGIVRMAYTAHCAFAGNNVVLAEIRIQIGGNNAATYQYQGLHRPLQAGRQNDELE